MSSTIKEIPKPLFFPNLNGIRFIAASLVVIHHIEQYKEKFGLPNHIFYLRIIRLMGPLGVFLFFVLSGFLITSLLLVEKEKTNTILIKNFYLRRVLRIWPLYFLIVLLGFFILPYIPFLHIAGETEFIHSDLSQKLLLYVLILPNIVTGVFKHIPYVSQTWSIGVEEQFYYFWPWVVRNNHKKLLTAMVLLLIFFFVIRTATVLYMPITGIWLYLNEFIKSLRITCMILGAIGAYFTYFHTKSQFVTFIFSKGFQLVLYATVIISFSLGMYIAGINQEIYSVLFALVIMNLAKNPKSILNLENPIFDFLGKISYGLYMYHTIAVVIGVKIAMMVGNNSNWISYPITFILTILVSWLSYSYIEKPFLKIKNRFTTVKSGKL